MTISVIWSSPNTDGLTAAAKNNILQGIAQVPDTKAQEIHLNSLHLEHCRACGNGLGICQSQGRCIIEDDLKACYGQLQQSDGMVFVTAVYWHDITECMKAFLDRIRRMETFHNHFLSGKKCLLVACAGGTGRGAIRCLGNLEVSMAHMNIIPVDRLPVIQFNKSYLLPALTQAGEAFAKAVQREA